MSCRLVHVGISWPGDDPCPRLLVALEREGGGWDGDWFVRRNVQGRSGKSWADVRMHDERESKAMKMSG